MSLIVRNIPEGVIKKEWDDDRTAQEIIGAERSKKQRRAVICSLI